MYLCISISLSTFQLYFYLSVNTQLSVQTYYITQYYVVCLGFNFRKKVFLQINNRILLHTSTDAASISNQISFSYLNSRTVALHGRKDAAVTRIFKCGLSESLLVLSPDILPAVSHGRCGRRPQAGPSGSQEVQTRTGGGGHEYLENRLRDQ
jgi:hypothetical protein